MIGSAAAALAKSLQTVAGGPLGYRRGTQTIELTGWPGTTEFETVGDNGEVIEQYQSRDFLLLAGELAIGGDVTLPKRGDVVLETIGGVQSAFEVMGPQAGGRPYRFSDTARTLLRVHTKQIKNE